VILFFSSRMKLGRAVDVDVVDVEDVDVADANDDVVADSSGDIVAVVAVLLLVVMVVVVLEQDDVAVVVVMKSSPGTIEKYNDATPHIIVVIQNPPFRRVPVWQMVLV
jgi:hypothetical protein